MKSVFGGNTETKDGPFEKFDNEEKQRNGAIIGRRLGQGRNVRRLLCSSKKRRQSGRERGKGTESKYRKCMTEGEPGWCRLRKVCRYHKGKIKEISFDGFDFSKKIISSADNYLEEMEEGLGSLGIKQVIKCHWESRKASLFQVKVRPPQVQGSNAQVFRCKAREGKCLGSSKVRLLSRKSNKKWKNQGNSRYLEDGDYNDVSWNLS